MLNDFAIIGGDKRFSYLAKLLCDKQFGVVACGLSNIQYGCLKLKIEVSLKQAILSSTNIICPIPFSRDDIFINNQSFKIDEFLSYINKNNVIFGGGFNTNIKALLQEKSKYVFDYLTDESFMIFNASLTAEAAVAQAVLQNPISLGSSRCLILGFGRCGKMLALKVKNLCEDVVVCSKDKIEIAFAKGIGIKSLNFAELKGNIHKFEFIFNTIPVRILTGNILDYMNKDVFVLDITANGIDLKEFAKRSINAAVSLQIPGKFKFKSAAEYLTNLTLKIINKIK